MGRRSFVHLPHHRSLTANLTLLLSPQAQLRADLESTRGLFSTAEEEKKQVEEMVAKLTNKNTGLVFNMWLLLAKSRENVIMVDMSKCLFVWKCLMSNEQNKQAAANIVQLQVHPWG